MAERTTTWDLDGLVVTDHVIDVPLDHDQPTLGTVEVFARVVAAPDGGDRPYLLYLQGGPGQESPRPSAMPANPSWLDRALRDYRVVLLDQRGTGLDPLRRRGAHRCCRRRRVPHPVPRRRDRA